MVWFWCNYIMLGVIYPGFPILLESAHRAILAAPRSRWSDVGKAAEVNTDLFDPSVVTPRRI